MPDPVSLADAGGWAVVVAVMIGIGVGAVKGWWVPGFVYKREVTRADAAVTQLDKVTDSLDKLTDEFGKLTTEVRYGGIHRSRTNESTP